MVGGIEMIITIICIGTVIANILITALVFKLYTEYWKDITIKRRYEKGGVKKTKIHNHPGLERSLELDSSHVIIDRDIFDEYVKQEEQ